MLSHVSGALAQISCWMIIFQQRQHFRTAQNSGEFPATLPLNKTLLNHCTKTECADTEWNFHHNHHQKTEHYVGQHHSTDHEHTHTVDPISIAITILIVIPLIEMCGCDWFKSRHVV